MDLANPTIASPCIKNCCLDTNDICLGCFRSLIEITQWAQATPETRLLFLDNAKKRQQIYHSARPGLDFH